MRLRLPELKRPSLNRGAGKGPSLRVPTFVADLYYDLRDRRLLPVVALVVVAIAATPLLLGEQVEPQPPSSASVGDLEAASGSAEATLTVVEANPGLRDYRKRLKGRTPTDPFANPSAGASHGGGGSAGGGGGAEPAGVSSSATSSESESPDAGATPESSPAAHGTESGGADKPDAPSRPPSAGGGGADDDTDSLEGRALFGFRPDVRFGVAGSGKLALREELPLGSLLPKQNAVVLFVGVTQDGQRALFSVAPEVVVRGDGGCVGGNENCRFLSMKEGDAVDLVTASGRSFRLKVLSIEFVELEVPPKAKQASGSDASPAKRSLARVLPAVGQYQR